MTDDEKVAQRYRALEAEEPTRALDEAILAAARRAAGAGPASLSVRSSRQRWYAPLATAAVLVLAVAVTLNMQHERPGIESPATRSPPPADQPASTQELKLKAEEQLASVAKQPAKEMSPARRKDAGQAAPAAPAVREPQPFAAERAPVSAGAAAPAAAPRADDSRRVESSVTTGSLAREMEERTSRDAEAASRAPRMGPFQAQAKRAENTANAERELERIAQLRLQGRHDEADKALLEFRKRFPDYAIPDAMRERVERR